MLYVYRKVKTNDYTEWEKYVEIDQSVRVIVVNIVESKLLRYQKDFGATNIRYT